MASDAPSQIDPTTADGSSASPCCPVCGYGFSSFTQGEPSVCPECGKDSARERQAVVRWHRGALKWAYAAGAVCACCLVATALSGNPQSLLLALFFEAIVGGIAAFTIAAWAWTSQSPRAVPSPSIYTGIVLRALTPIAMLPVVIVSIWVWYVPLAHSGGGWSNVNSANETLGRLTTIALSLCGVVWVGAMVIGLPRARSLGRMAVYAAGVLITSACLAVLCGFATIAVCLSIVGADGRGP